MPKFRLAARVSVSAYTTVEADTLEAAVAASINRPVELAGGPYKRSEYWIIDDADGSPDAIELDMD